MRSWLLLFTATTKARTLFFIFLFFFPFLYFLYLFFRLCVFSFWSLVTYDRDSAIFAFRLALIRAYGKLALISFSALVLFCALGSVHDRSCIGVTLPLRLSLLCGYLLFVFLHCFSSSLCSIRLLRLQTVMNKRTRRFDNDLSMLSFVV